jgi:hypothetical protein
MMIQMNDEKITRIAEFMGWERSKAKGDQNWREIEVWEGEQYPFIFPISEDYMHSGSVLEPFNPLRNWNDWMLVEAHIRGHGEWFDYIDALAGIMGMESESSLGIEYVVMATTLEQRAEALMSVLEAKDE